MLAAISSWGGSGLDLLPPALSLQNYPFTLFVVKHWKRGPKAAEQQRQ